MDSFISGTRGRLVTISKRTIFIALFVLLPGAWSQEPPCGVTEFNPHGRVVGGTASLEKSWPWIGSLRRSSGGHSCGATLISERWAITAAHCVGHITSIALGDLLLDTNSPGHVSRGFRVFVHPEYGGNSRDVALLRLDRNVTFTDYVKPACLSTNNNEATSYSNCWVTGWGVTSEGGSIPNVMQEAPVGLFTRARCIEFYGSSTDDDYMICAGREEGGIDTCQGDSGGPLVCENEAGAWELVGITSWGRGCARPNFPGVYARVSRLSDFIQQTMSTDYLDCPNGQGMYVKEDECDGIADCAGGDDEEECPTLTDVIELQSPSYPSDYPHSQRIVWVFRTEVPSANFSVHFSDFDLESGYDFVSVGTGWLDTDEGSILGTYTGSGIPQDIITVTDRIWIRFTSDFSVSKRGFKAMVSAIGAEGVVECSADKPCTGQHETCGTTEINNSTIPKCVCVQGFSRDDGTCIDVNECLYSGLNTCNVLTEVCINEIGTFSCECKPEYFSEDGCDAGDVGGDPNRCGISAFTATGRGETAGTQEVLIQHWPWMASLQHTSHVCSATLIGENWAITAAACIGYFSKIVLGEGHQERSVTVYKHPQYNEATSANDIAVVELSEAVDVNFFVRPVCVSSELEYVRCFITGWNLLAGYVPVRYRDDNRCGRDFPLPDGEPAECNPLGMYTCCSNYGWCGNTPDHCDCDSCIDYGVIPSEFLEEAEVEIYSSDECSSMFGNDYNPETMVCAGLKNASSYSCRIDHGDPLVCLCPNNNWHIVGTKSWGVDCAPGLYTRMSHYTEFIELIENSDFRRCPDGSILLAEQICDYVVDCSDWSDEINCAGLEVGEEFTFTSPNFPGEYPNSIDIIYVIPAEEGNYLFIRFSTFNLENGYDILYYSDKNITDPTADPTSLTGSTIPSDITARNAVWFHFQSDATVTKAGFEAQITAVASDAFFECDNGKVLLNSSVCDLLVDCPTAEDETGCDALPDGIYFMLSSINYPDDYPNNYESTHVFIAEEYLNVYVLFYHLDLEDGFDFLKIGHGLDPSDPSSVLHTFTGQDLPGEILSPESTLWMTFTSDSSVVKTGYLFNVSITSRAREPCSVFLVVTEEEQSTERYQTHPGEKCGISLIGENVNMAVRITIKEAEIDCNVGEFLIIQRTRSGREQKRKTKCGRITSKTFTGGDSVMLIDYNLKMAGHGFGITYQLVRDTFPNFRGCNRLISLRGGGPVTFSSPGYPNNYRPKRKCENRILSYPGTRILVVFEEFQLEDHETCKYDFVKLTDFVTSENSPRLCGTWEELSFNSTSHYLSVYFRSNFKDHFRGYSAVAWMVE